MYPTRIQTLFEEILTEEWEYAGDPNSRFEKMAELWEFVRGHVDDAEVARAVDKTIETAREEAEAIRKLDILKGRFLE